MNVNIPEKKAIIENLLFLLLGGLYCWSLSCAVSGFSLSLVNSYMLLGISFAATLVLIVILSNRIFVILGILAAAGLIIVNISKITDIIYLLISGETSSFKQQLLLMIIITLIISLFTCISLKLSVNFFLLGAVGIVLYCIAFKEGTVTGVSFYAFLLVMLILFLTRIYSNKIRNSETNLGSSMLQALLPAAFAVIIAAVIAIPFSSTSETSPLFPYDSLKDFIQRGLLGGFSQSINFEKEEYILSGSFDMDSQPLLSVSGETNIDLYGGIADKYTGYSWTKSNSQDEVFLNEYQTVDSAALKSIQASASNTESITTESISIEYLLESDVIFTPRFANLFDRFGNRQVYLSQLGEFSADNVVSSGGTIEITYYKDFLRDMYGLGNLSSALKRYDVSQIAVEGVFNNQDLTYYKTWDESTLNDYIKSVEKQYTTLPSTVTERTYELAETLTSGFEDTSSKAEAVRNYLVQSYTYTLTPTDPPVGSDFVDYFLFEEQQGFCDSFATAMVVLCRTQGIPARFVYGYHVPASSDSDGNHIVRNRSQHAWAEIYIEGYGWCVFESTPPYAYVTAGQDVKPSIIIDENGGEDMETHLADLGLMMANQDAIPEWEQEITQEQSQIIESTEESKTATPEVSSSATPKKETKSRLPFFIAAGFLIVIMLLILMRYRIRISKEHKARKGTADDLAKFSFDHIVQLAEFNGNQISQSKTPIEIMEQLSSTYPMLKDNFRDAGKVYSVLSYSNKPINQNQAIRLYQTYTAFDMYTKESEKDIRFIVAKYFVQKI